MVRSLSNAGVFASSVFNRWGGRGYGAAATAPGVWAASPDKGGRVAQNKEKDPGNAEEKSDTQPTWAPDPITGFYKPSCGSPEICPASLREMIFSQRKLKPRN